MSRQFLRRHNTCMLHYVQQLCTMICSYSYSYLVYSGFLCSCTSFLTKDNLPPLD